MHLAGENTVTADVFKVFCEIQFFLQDVLIHTGWN